MIWSISENLIGWNISESEFSTSEVHDQRIVADRPTDRPLEAPSPSCNPSLNTETAFKQYFSGWNYVLQWILRCIHSFTDHDVRSLVATVLPVLFLRAWVLTNSGACAYANLQNYVTIPKFHRNIGLNKDSILILLNNTLETAVARRARQSLAFPLFHYAWDATLALKYTLVSIFDTISSIKWF